MTGPYNIAVSPDGRNAYVTTFSEGGLAVFSRDTATGALAQLPGLDGCFTVDGTSTDGGPGTCTDARAMSANNEGANIAISSDGRFLYFGAAGTGLLSFSRDTSTGKLTQLGGLAGCITNDGSSEDGNDSCTEGRAMDDVDGLALSPDGTTLYGVGTEGIAVLSRDASSGVLTQLAGLDGCITPDGSSDDGNDTCTDGKGVNYSNEVAASPDGMHVYAVGYNDNTVTAFSRNPASGALTQLSGLDGCVSLDGSSDEGVDTCADGRAIDGPFGLGISPDGKNVYAGLFDHQGGLVAFARDAASGRLTQLAGTAGCITVDGSSPDDGVSSCQDGRGTAGTYHVGVSPDGLSVYAGVSGAQGGLTAYRRDPATGALAQLAGLDGCVSNDGSALVEGPGICASLRAIDNSGPFGFSPDGVNLYAPGYDDEAFAILTRELPPGCTNADVQSTSAGVAVPLTCVDRNGDAVTRTVLSQPSNGTLGSIDQAAGTVRYTPKAGFEGTDTFTFRGDDGGELPGSQATATIAVNDTKAASCKPRSRKVSLRKLEAGGVTLKLRCNEPARVTAEMVAARKVAKGLGVARSKVVVLGKGSKRAGKAGVVKVKVKLKRKARRALKPLSLRQAKRLKLAVRVTTRDNGKNRGRKTTKLKLKR